MNTSRSIRSILSFLTFLSLLVPSVLWGHPGHYHPPGETDEFDALRADYLHLHGTLEISLVMVALAGVAVFMINKNRRIRTAAALVCGGSLALIAAL